MTLLGPVPPPYGGVSVHMQRLRELLEGAGIRHRVLTLTPGAEAAASGARQIGHEPAEWPRSLWTVGRATGPGGVIHNHSSLLMYPMARRLGALLATTRALGIRRIENVYDATLVERFPALARDERRALVHGLAGAARVISIGTVLRDFLADVGVPEGRIRLVTAVLPPRSRVPALPAEFAPFFARHRSVWIAVGAAVPLYDFATIARAFRTHAQHDPDAGLVLVAGGFSSEPAYQRTVHDVLADVRERVLLVTDVPHPHVQALLGAASVMIRGAERDSYGASKIEALFAGTPVVTTPNGAVDHMHIYRHGDPVSLLAAVGQALGAGGLDVAAARDLYLPYAHGTLQTYLDAYAELGVARA